MLALLSRLEADTIAAEKVEDMLEKAKTYESRILADMEALRTVVDAAELLIPDDYLPYPTYSRLLFSLR